MRPEIASPRTPASPRGLVAVPIYLPIAADDALPAPKAFTNKAATRGDYNVMTRWLWLLWPLLAGLIITLLQLAMAIGLLAPEGSFSDRYATLVQHDSYWFMNIVDRGYQTIVPPIDHKVMEVSNVAFFPAYPAIAAAFRYGLNISTGTALLITAQLAAWGFWSYFFLFCKRWNISPALQICGALFSRRPSCSILSNCWLLGIAVFDGAAWLHLLEYCGGAIREILGGRTRHCDVRNADRRNCVRGISVGALGFSNSMPRPT